ncbi:MAG: hypothetical protein Q9221_006858 [Calogaya cf. arnoldii]
MSCRISTVQAEFESAKLVLNSLPSRWGADLAKALEAAHEMIEWCQVLCSETEFYGPTFSSIQMLVDVIEEEDFKNETGRLDPARISQSLVLTEMEPRILEFHQRNFRSQSIAVWGLLLSMKNLRCVLIRLLSLSLGFFVLIRKQDETRLDADADVQPVISTEDEPWYPPHEYVTSLLTYTVRSPNQGFFHDEWTMGPEYCRFHEHKGAIKDLSRLLEPQKAHPVSTLSWQGNMEQLCQKVGGWAKEMEWADASFRRGFDNITFKV